MSDYGDSRLQELLGRLAKNLERDELVQATTDYLKDFLNVDRIVLYYFYYEWKGRVTFESLSSLQFSIFGSTGADDCFNDEYAKLYQAGRVKAIPDIKLEPLHPCHREFLESIGVRANLVVPILNSKRLWGLLIAHHCRDAHFWLPSEIKAMKQAAVKLAKAASIHDS